MVCLIERRRKKRRKNEVLIWNNTKDIIFDCIAFAQQEENMLGFYIKKFFIGYYMCKESVKASFSGVFFSIVWGEILFQAK